MSDRDIDLLILDIKLAIEAILEYTNSYDFDTYLGDVRTQHAVERNFQIIGEAAGRIPIDYKVINAHIEWRIIKDFRNFIIHEYFGINQQIVWDTICFRLPNLLIDITYLLKKD